MKYILKKDHYLSSKSYIWKDGRCLGYIFSEVKEMQDIDWTKYKQDKTLKMSISDRLTVKYNAMCYPNESCGQHDSIEKAIVAIEDKQDKIFTNLKNCLTITIGADDV
jgi:adenine specific DNA methylase Mod